MIGIDAPTLATHAQRIGTCAQTIRTYAEMTGAYDQTIGSYAPTIGAYGPTIGTHVATLPGTLLPALGWLSVSAPRMSRYCGDATITENTKPNFLIHFTRLILA